MQGSSCVAVQSLTCSACPANTFYAGETCAACPGETVSVAGSAACQCRPGFTGDGTSCQACPAGTYKRMAGTSACRSCQANSVSQVGSALCGCAPGYTGKTGEVCVACVAGKYKNASGSAAGWAVAVKKGRKGVTEAVAEGTVAAAKVA